MTYNGTALDMFLSTCKDTLGKKDTRRKPWISDDTWTKIVSRREKKEKRNTSTIVLQLVGVVTVGLVVVVADNASGILLLYARLSTLNIKK